MLGFFGILLGIFSIGMMQLILAAALPFIVEEIGGANMYSWVFSGYMLASLASIPLFSKLADTYGKRKFYILGMCIFSAGSIYGGLAPSMAHLVSGRAVQGFGAGIITPVSMAMVTDMFPAEKRGHMIGVFGFVQLLSNLLSPPLGSFVTKNLGWQWIFFMTVGLAASSVLLVSLTQRPKDTRSAMKLSEIDIWGGLIFGGFCILTVSFSNTLSSQNTPLAIALLLAAIASAVWLIFHERKHKDPVIKVEFLKIKVIRRSIISSILAGAIMYGLVTILPLCGAVLNFQGFNIDESRLLLIFMISITSGLLISSRTAVKSGSVYFTGALWIAMLLSSIMMIYSIGAGMILMFNILCAVIGLCTGAIMATFLINSQNAVDSKDRTVLSGLVQLGRYFGASIGVTILTGILPEISSITAIGQFAAAFKMLAALCVVGIVNEVI